MNPCHLWKIGAIFADGPFFVIIHVLLLLLSMLLFHEQMDYAILLPVTEWILIIGRAIGIRGPLQIAD
jgi:hypothetical protein